MADYTNSELVKHLVSADPDRYVSLAGKSWWLIYGNGDGTPAVGLFATAVTTPAERLAKTVGGELVARDVFRRLFDAAKLPVAQMRFVSGDAGLAKDVGFGWLKPGAKATIVTAAAMANELAAKGLVTGATAGAAKPLNDTGSGVFHAWQRQHMPVNAAVDLDLIECDSAGGLKALIEIKRSKVPLGSWAPYLSDAVNYRMGYRLASKAGLDPMIFYTHMSAGPPRVEDIECVVRWRQTDAKPSFERLDEIDVSALT